MIYGRKQKLQEDGKVYDYLGCLYPEGFIEPQFSFFNHSDIAEVVFKGFENEEEQFFKANILTQADITEQEEEKYIDPASLFK